jgi:hypothetical protein
MGAELEKSQSAVGLATGERIASRVQGHTLLALLEATRELYGESWVARLGSHLPSSMLTRLRERSDWIPVEYVMAWFEAAWDGPLVQDEAALRRFVDRIIDLSFGRVRRLLLSIVPPHGIVRRGPELWRGELSDGRFVSYATSPTSAHVAIYEHPLLDSAVMRLVTVEALRYSLSLSGAKDLVAHHEGGLGEPLVISMSWRG